MSRFTHSFAPAFRHSLSVLALACGLLAQSSAHAVALNQPVAPALFTNTALPGTTVASRPELAGTVLEDLITPFSFEGITGTVQNRVVRSTATGTLDFYWKINVDTAATDVGVVALRLTNFGYDALTDADWRIDGLGSVAPGTARLFSEANHPDGALNFLFGGNGVATGQQSRFFFLHTDAVAYAQTASFDLLGGARQALSPGYATFAPAPVPEPSTYALTLAGVAAIALVVNRRRRGS